MLRQAAADRGSPKLLCQHVRLVVARLQPASGGRMPAAASLTSRTPVPGARARGRARQALGAVADGLAVKADTETMATAAGFTVLTHLEKAEAALTG